MEKKAYTKIQMRIPLLLFIFVIVLAACGTATAQTDPNAQLPDVYVVDTGEGFTGSTPLQDSVDSSNTLDGSYVIVNPGTYSQQVNINKNLYIIGAGTTPADTTLEFNTDGNVITVPEGVVLTIENMAITNTGTGRAIGGDGAVNLINCVINENYVEPTSDGLTGMETESPTKTMAAGSESLSLVSGSTENPAQTTEETNNPVTEPTTALVTPVTTTSLNEEQTASEPSTDGTNGTSTTPGETGLPLTTMAYGMLMVVGGVVFQRKNDLQ